MKHTKGLAMRPIPGYDNYYVSRCGKVYSEHYGGRFLSLQTKSGYIAISLRKGGDSKQYYVHRLVALAYLPNPENKRTVNHKDGNKHNNHASNLEWCTHEENMRHAVLTGIFRTNTGKPSKRPARRRPILLAA